MVTFTSALPPVYCQHCRKEIEPAWYGCPAKHKNRKYCNRACLAAHRRSQSFTEHGTIGGYQKCRRRPDGPCPSCKDAQTADWKERQVHRRATAALVEMYPIEYQQLRDQLANLKVA